jgi:hypothetical protein
MHYGKSIYLINQIVFGYSPANSVDVNRVLYCCNAFSGRQLPPRPAKGRIRADGGEMTFASDLLSGLLCFDCFHHLADIAQASLAGGVICFALTAAGAFFPFDLFQDG